MALNFPNDPDDGDTYEGYVWNDTVGAWQSGDGSLKDQTIQVFDNESARDAAILSPIEGQFFFLKDVDALEFFNGTSFVVF